jgi:hypothetical protein
VNDYFLVRSEQCFQLYHGENKLLFNEIMMFSALYSVDKQARWNFIVLRDCRETCKLEVLEPTSLVWIQNTYHIQNNVKTADLFSVLSKIENGFPYNSLKRTSVWNFIVFINLYHFLYYLLFVLLYCKKVVFD